MKTHRFNPAAGGMGLCFIILAGGFFLDAIGVWNAEAAWLAPVFLIAFGAAGVLSTVARGFRHEPPPQFDPAWAGSPTAPPQPQSPREMAPETPTDPWTAPESPTSQPEETV